MMRKSSIVRAARCLARPLLALLVMGGTALLSGEQALSQGATSPTDLLQIFQNLPQEQQDAILKQFGASGGGGVGGILGALGGGGGAAGQGGAARQRTAVSEEQATQAAEEVEPPGLKGEDWVIIQVTLPSRPSIPTAVPIAAPAPATVTPGLPPGVPAGATQSSLATLMTATATSPAPPPGGEISDAAAQAERERLQPLIDLIRSKNPYRLSREGALTLPGFAPIALTGLSDEQATLRLSVEPALRGIDIRLTRLPLRKTGCRRTQALRLRHFRQETAFDLRARDQRAVALRLHRRPR